ncbi:MAG: hypothetical protein WDM79_07300 [Terricaulis sp.]
MQEFTDIRDLWTRDIEDAWLLYSEAMGAQGRVPQFSVMLMDCAKLGWDAKALVAALDRGDFDYKGLMHDFAMMPPERKRPLLEFEWNSLETYVEGETKLIHYTDMPTQPWVSDKNKNGEVWYAEVRRAVADGFITREEIDEEIARGHVSPMLPTWAGLKPYPTRQNSWPNGCRPISASRAKPPEGARVKIGWKPKSNDPKVASVRFRCLTPLGHLQRDGYPIELFDASQRYDAVIFSKLYGRKDQALARELRAQARSRCSIFPTIISTTRKTCRSISTPRAIFGSWRNWSIKLCAAAIIWRKWCRERRA